ncbi:MAG: hypothetical protein KA717_12520 [Woronichinia naegeliana WA131]|uniref:Uncharacterized protein n=1 Tax=Woronichinia naegeliana WA131 TaxID=2824559 RepID=A0A977L0R1_9CYAN|nr:MAG: hypothetical protein KA717_12520 [Woronichinia naegeliana WA131]
MSLFYNRIKAIALLKKLTLCNAIALLKKLTLATRSPVNHSKKVSNIF